MAAEVFPISVQYPANGNVVPGFITTTQGHKVVASLGADSDLRLEFQVPPALPSGTAKLRVRAKANLATGAVKFNPKWNGVAAEEDIDTTTLNAEGTQTISFTTGDENDLKELKVTLDSAGSSIAAEDRVVVNFTFETTGWTAAGPVVFQVSLIWE